jgi:DMSO/TMAO reductase YedYZ molybdopterin-dependent catalytic subunit
VNEQTSNQATAEPPISLRAAAFAGTVSVGLALGLTELAAGLTDKVPSSIAAVGGFVIDWSPRFVKEFAISFFGTADKGALAIGTAIVALLVGALIGAIARTHPWVATAAFGFFGLAGFGAASTEIRFSFFPTLLALVIAAGAGLLVLRALLYRTVEAPTDGVPSNASRRIFIGSVAGVGVAALVAGVGGRRLIINRSERVRADAVLPSPPVTVPPPGPNASFAIEEELTPIIVPNKDFYRIDTALVVPRPDPDSWRLKVTGMVDNELELSLDDLAALPIIEDYVTISCVSNDVGGHLVGNAKWTGVRLVDILDRAGVQEGAGQIVGRSVDGWTSGFPTDLAYDGREPILALGMNGEPLPPNHGYPARLIVPGLYGYVSATKWIEEIELTTWDGFDGYWIPRGWSKEGPIKTQSRIDRPGRGQRLPGSPAVLAGVAWAPTRGIERVEVQIDDGEWLDAELTTPLSDKAWVQWKVEQTLTAGDHEAKVRATDSDGYTQTSEKTSPAPNGATGWHTVDFVTV